MNRRTAAAAALAAAGLALAGCAGRQWRNVGIGGGGGIFVPSTSPHDPRLMFCASDMSGVYRSTDGGRSWRMLPWRQLSGAINCAVAFHPTDPEVCYCIPRSQVLKVSRDRGRSWGPLTDQRPWADLGGAGRIEIDPAGEVMIVGAARGAVRSDDGGKTWSRCRGLGGPLDTAVFARDAWYAGTGEAVVTSTDRGRTWRPVPGALPGERLLAFVGGCDRATGRTVLYVSVPSRADGGRFAGGIYRSEDGGATWVGAMGEGINTTTRPSGPVSRRVPQYPFLGMPTNQTDTVYAYGYGNGTIPPKSTTVYRTDDGGRSWRAVMFGPRGLTGQNVELAWMDLDMGWGGDGILSFHVNARSRDVVAWSSATEIYATCDGGRRWYQAYSRCADGRPDRGKAWVSTGMEMTTCWQYKFDPHDPRRTYICYTDIGFARSTDRGRSWYYARAGCPWPNTFYDLIFDPDRPGVLYAACADRHDIPSWKMAGGFGGGGGVCVSEDFGRTWRRIGSGMPRVGACMAVVLDPAGPPERRTMWAVWHGAGVYRSSDGGRTWRAKNRGLDLAYNSHFTDLKRCRDSTLYALCGAKRKDRTALARGGLFKSTDGGESWTELTAELDLKLPYGFDVHPDDSRTIWLCASAVPQIHDPAGVYKSTDGGASWRKLKVDWPASPVGYVHAKFPSIDPQRPQRVWVSTGTHGLIVTTDGGRTWREVKGLPFGGANRVTVDPSDRERIWVSTFGGGIWTGPAMGADG